MARALTVTAIVATFNEEDVIGVVLADLLGQGVRVHLLDQGSTDATVAEAQALQGRGDLRIERFEGDDFSLARIIRRKEALAAELDTDWVVNADADEFRESPWPGVGFVEGIREVDRLGFNAVDFDVLNFVPVDDGFHKGDDPRERFRFYERGGFFDRLQIRCWKKPAGPLDLVSTAGHEARFKGRRVFPIRFLLRHYPIRSQAHGERKVFRERRPRFSAEERARGWHVQYDTLAEGASFLREPSSLTPYDPWQARIDLALRHRGVEALEQELSRCGQALGGRDAELDRRAQELSSTRGVLTGQLAACRQELSSAREVVTLLDRDLAASREGLKALHHHAEQTRDDLLRGQEALRAERDEHARESLRLRLDAARLEGELRRRGEEAGMLRQEIAATAEAGERRLAALRYRLDAVLSSRIWRWTSSLRASIDALSR